MCSTEVVRANQSRCDEILECKRQMEYWKSKLEVLEEEQTRHIKLARLRLDATSTWRSLSRKERLEKPYILAALESEEMPTILEDFPNSAFPPHIRLDREILLARIARPDFERRYRDERLFVPPKLRGDKEVILTIIPKHAQVIECISCELRDDEEILDAILANETLPSHFLQHFSERIRSNEEIMLKTISHPQGLSSLAFCSQDLKNDKDFLTNAIECGNHQAESQVLRHASHRLRAERDIVYLAVQKSGMNLKHAAYSLRRDAGVVLAASAENGTAFRYCLPGSVKDDLLGDREFVLKVVQSAPNSIMKSCINRFKEDREVLLLALAHGLEWCSIPEALQHDKGFIMEALQRNPQLYMDLSEETRDNFDVAFQVIHVDDVADDVILEATERCPDLLANRVAMLAIAKNWWTDVLQETLQFSPSAIRNDKAIIMEAVKNDPVAFEYCSEELQSDREVVLAAIEASPSSLYLVMDSFQYENPDVVILALEKTDRGDLWTTYDDVYDELWTNRDVAMAWLSKGGDWLADDFPEDFWDDEELLLTVAKHNWTEFDCASENLRNDKEFMLKALALDGRVIRDVSEDLRHDYDLALAAFGKDLRSLQFFSGPEDFEFMVSLTNQVRERLEDCSFFMREMVGSIYRRPSADEKCLLPMLNQGPDTVQMYQTTLSSFLGLPHGEELAHLQETSKNLLAWGF